MLICKATHHIIMQLPAVPWIKIVTHMFKKTSGQVRYCNTFRITFINKLNLVFIFSCIVRWANLLHNNIKHTIPHIKRAKKYLIVDKYKFMKPRRSTVFMEASWLYFPVI